MSRPGPRWGDVGIGLAIVFLAAAGFLFLSPRSTAPGAAVEVTVRGQQVAELDLNVDAELEVEVMGGMAKIVVHDRRVRVVDTHVCPLKICVHTGWIDRPGQGIVCLPNRLIVRVVQGNQ